MCPPCCAALCVAYCAGEPVSALLIQAELVKLSRLLGVSVDELGVLNEESVTDLRALRGVIGAALHDQDRALFGKLVAATKLLPTAIVAVIAEKVMGPMLCARVAGLLEPKQVVEVAKRLSTPFLTEVCLQLDPRSAAAVLRQVPLAVVTAVSAELLRRHEYLTMARFVEVITDEAVQAVAKSMPDAAVLHLGYFVESPQRLTELVALFDDRRIHAIVRAALADPARLWPEALSLMAQTDSAACERLVRLGLAGDEAVLLSLLQAVNQQQLHRELLAVLKRLGPGTLTGLAGYPRLADPELLGPTFEAAAREGALGHLFPLAVTLEPPLLVSLASRLERLPAKVARGAAIGLAEPDCVAPLQRGWARLRHLIPAAWVPSALEVQR